MGGLAAPRTASPTSRCSPTPTSPRTAASRSTRIPRSAPGSIACARRPVSFRCPRPANMPLRGSRSPPDLPFARPGRPRPALDLRMAMTLPNPIPARMKGLNRAEICDVHFVEFVNAWDGRADARPAPQEAILDGSALDAQGFRELFESQLISRHLDLMARVLRVQNKVFYTIGSSGHEGNTMVARAA